MQVKNHFFEHDQSKKQNITLLNRTTALEEIIGAKPQKSISENLRLLGQKKRSK